MISRSRAKTAKKTAKKSATKTTTTKSAKRKRTPGGGGPRGAAASPPEPKCTALFVRVGEHLDGDADALALARRVVARTLAGAWTVTALGEGVRDFRVRRADGGAIPVGRAWELVRALLADRDVADAEPQLVAPGLEPTEAERALLPRPVGGPVRAGGPQDDALPCSAAPAFDWSLSLCSVQQAWGLPIPDPTSGKAQGEGIIVGHPDTGHTEHAEIFSGDAATNRILAAIGRDFFKGTASCVDPLDGKNPGHGTATSSVIMADATVTPGDRVDGVAPKAKLVPLRVTNSVVLFDFGTLAEALHYAVAAGCHVVSISLGGAFRSRTLHRAVQHAVDSGVIVLAAAGNVWPWVVYPARFDEVVAVAACNCQCGIWRSSASGSDVDVTAPGESVWVARTRKKGSGVEFVRERGSGTSFAVATTAGICALWLAHHGRDRLLARYGARRLASVFKELVITQGVNTPAGWQKDRHGAGIIDARKLLAAPLPPTPAAVGMRVRASAAPPPVSLLDEIMTFFPRVSRARVRAGLARFLGVPEAELQAALAELGDEVLFHVSTDPFVRAEIARAPGAPAMASVAVRRAASARLRRTASTEIRRRRGLR